jgi:hypothetical protein
VAGFQLQAASHFAQHLNIFDTSGKEHKPQQNLKLF